jgi:hypothetical protein
MCSLLSSESPSITSVVVHSSKVCDAAPEIGKQNNGHQHHSRKNRWNILGQVSLDATVKIYIPDAQQWVTYCTLPSTTGKSRNQQSLLAKLANPNYLGVISDVWRRYVFQTPHACALIRVSITYSPDYSPTLLNMDRRTNDGPEGCNHNYSFDQRSR